MSILIFIAILLVLVVAHEFGHFILAKKSGARVDEFAFGFPPKLFSKKYGETTYILNALPIGGYVKIHGEDASEQNLDEARSLTHKPRYIQAAVILGGILANILVSWVLFSLILMMGMQTSVGAHHFGELQNPQVIVTQVLVGSPAEKVGLHPGDILISARSLTDSREPHALVDVDDLSEYITEQHGAPIVLTYSRHGVRTSSEIVPKVLDETERALIGIAMDKAGELQLPFHTAILEGAIKTTEYFIATASGIYHFLLSAIMGEGSFSEVSGPVGIVQAVGSAASLGFAHILFFTALISLNLAVINLIPFPALDGGRFLFILIESVTRKKLSPAVTTWANFIGFALLMLLMAVVTYHDVIKIIK
jgi:regulator of sigma E protease